jgi:hydrogenase expression/formation protein HypC
MCLAIPMKLIRVDEGDQGLVEVDGMQKTISLALLEERPIGAYVLVHAGYGLQLVDEEEAKKTLELLREFTALKEELGPEHKA